MQEESVNQFCMRICKIMTSYPTKAAPGAGLTNLVPAAMIDEPTLIIVPHSGRMDLELPGHVSIRYVRSIVRRGPGPMSKLGRRLRRPAQVFFLMEYGLRCVFIALGFRPGLVFFGIMNLFPALILRRLSGCKLALTLHNVTEVEFILKQKLLLRLLRNLDLVFVVSSPMKQQLETALPGIPIIVRPTGVDLSLFTPTGADRQRRIITVGSFKWKKGYTHLIEAMAIVHAADPTAALLIVGDGEERPQIEARIADLGLNACVELKGTVDQPELVRLLNESSIFVLASLREGLPKSLLEALATGTPAVVTTGCNASDFIREAGIEVPAGDAEALAGALLRLLDDPVLREEYSANAPAVAARFSWDAVAKIEHDALNRLFA